MIENSIQGGVTERDDVVVKTHRFRPGDSILGRYTVFEELGQGGMGVVYKCFDTVGGVEVAVKGVPPEVSHNNLEMEGIRENYQLVRCLRHPNIAGVTSLEQEQLTRGSGNVTLPDTPGDYYLVMDFAAGENLEHWLKHNRDADMSAKLSILRQVAEALDYAHKCGVMHRDIKPENIMVDSAGHVSVLDFGLAERIRTSLSRVSMEVTSRSGTPSYKSPEQWMAQPQGPAADIYALGVVAYVLFSGRLPFASDDMKILRLAVLNDPMPEIHDVPPAVNDALRRALAKRPDDRFGACVDFVDALEGKTPPRLRWLRFLPIAGIIALAGVGSWLLHGRCPGEADEPPSPANTNDTARVGTLEVASFGVRNETEPPVPEVKDAVAVAMADPAPGTLDAGELADTTSCDAETPKPAILSQRPAAQSKKKVWSGFRGQSKKQFEVIEEFLASDDAKDETLRFNCWPDEYKVKKARVDELRTAFQSLRKVVLDQDERLAKEKLKLCIELYNKFCQNPKEEK